MTEQHSPDERELEQSTTHQLAANNGASQTAKAARQDWLALGAAAEELGRDGLNEMALLASLQSELIKTPVGKAETIELQSFDWSWIAVAVAASVLIGATIVGVMSQRGQPIPAHQQLAQPQPQPPQRPIEPSPIQPSPIQIAETPDAGMPSSVNTTSSWDDVDDAISTTYTALQELANQQRGVDRSLTDFDSQLKQLSAEISGESL